jgi:SRSO17 transposase
VERKTCWSLAEHAGHADPQPMQRLLRTAVWDADKVRDDVRDWLIERLGHPQGVLIGDETGFVKKGTCSVGVQRQYTGTAGRIENSQVAVFLAYASPHGRGLIDRRLYLPETTWCQQPERRAAASVPTDIAFATKPALARQMITAALDGGIQASWFTGDEVYGADPGLRGDLEQRGIGYVLAASCDRRVAINDGRTLIRADDLAAQLPDSAWQPYSCGPGAKGPRIYLWAWITTATHPDEHRALLIRRNPHTGELAYYLCWSPHPVPLRTLVRVAGCRWSIEELFQTSKNETGLDHYQVRGWTPWHRFITLAMLALAILTTLTTQDDHDHDAEHIAITVAETRRLLNALIITPAHDLAHAMRWSLWRRKVQARARRAHYQHRLTRDSQLMLEY